LVFALSFNDSIREPASVLCNSDDNKSVPLLGRRVIRFSSFSVTPSVASDVEASCRSVGSSFVSFASESAAATLLAEDGSSLMLFNQPCNHQNPMSPARQFNWQRNFLKINQRV